MGQRSFILKKPRKSLPWPQTGQCSRKPRSSIVKKSIIFSSQLRSRCASFFSITLFYHGALLKRVTGEGLESRLLGKEVDIDIDLIQGISEIIEWDVKGGAVKGMKTVLRDTSQGIVNFACNILSLLNRALVR